jgi:hypothetical protein
MKGWDFRYLAGRWVEQDPPWDYRKEVVSRFHSTRALLDLGTGGGEILSSMVPLPDNTVATEGYPPNASIALKNLAPPRSFNSTHFRGRKHADRSARRAALRGRML